MKKYLALLLCFVMVVGMLPASALAELKPGNIYDADASIDKTTWQYGDEPGALSYGTPVPSNFTIPGSWKFYNPNGTLYGTEMPTEPLPEGQKYKAVLDIELPPAGDGVYAVEQDTDTVEFTITKRDLTITVASPDAITYGDPIPTTFAAIATGLASGDSVTRTLSTTATADSDAGTYPINVSDVVVKHGDTDVTDYYNVTTEPGTLTINKADRTAAMVTAPVGAEDLEYTGGAQALLSSLASSTDGGVPYYKILDVTAWKKTNPTATDPGTYTVKWVIEATDNYNRYVGEAITVVIASAKPTCTDPTLVADFTYNGAETSLIDAEPDDLPADCTLQYSVKEADAADWSAFADTATAKDVGTYSVKYKIVSTGAFDSWDDDDAVVLTDTVTIEPYALTVTVTDDVVKAYGDDDPTIDYTADLQGADAGSEATIFSGALSRDPLDEDPGDYAIVVGTLGLADDDGNYTFDGEAFTTDKKFTITANAMPDFTPTLTTVDDLEYTGELQQLLDTAPEASPQPSEIKVGDDTIGNVLYAVAPVADFADIEDPEDLADFIADLDYAEFSTDEDDPWPAAKDAGEYAVFFKFVAVAGSGYVDTDPARIEGTVEIDKTDLEITAKSYTTGYAYGSTGPDELEVETDGLVEADEADFTCDVIHATIKAAKDYTLTPSDAMVGTKPITDNYNVTYVNGTLTISPAELHVAPKDDYTMAYGETPVSPLEYTVTTDDLQYDDTEAIVTGELACTVSSTSDVITDGYPITIGTLSAGSNYTIVLADAVYMVTPATASFTDDGELVDDFDYTGEEEDLIKTAPTPTGGTLKYSVDGGTTWADTATGTNAGDYTVMVKVAADSDNYEDSDAAELGTVTISPVEVTLELEDQTIAYGADDPDWTVAITGIPGTTEAVTGIKSGDADSFGNVFTFEVTRDPGTEPGDYTVSPTGTPSVAKDEVENYTLTYEATATLTISGADYELTPPTLATPGAYNGLAQDLVAETGTVDPEEAGTIMYLAVPTGTSEEDVADSEDWAAVIPTAINAGTYDVYYKFVPASGYAAVAPTPVGAGSVTIAQAAITVKAKDATRELNASNPAGEIDEEGSDFTNLVEGHEVTCTSYSYGTLVPDAIGEYTITPAKATVKVMDGATDVTANYDITVAPGTLTVTKFVTVFTDAPAFTSPLDYAGEQALLTGEAATESGEETIKYFVSTEETAPAADAEGWVTGYANAKATNAGTYYVYYMAEESENYTGLAPDDANCVTVVIAPIAASIGDDGELVDDFDYDGAEAELIKTEPTATGGTVKYSLDDGETWVDAADVTGTDAGTYTILVKVVKDDSGNYEDSEPAEFGAVVISPADVTLELENKEIAYGAEDPTWTVKITGIPGTTEALEGKESGFTDDFGNVFTFTATCDNDGEPGEYTINPGEASVAKGEIANYNLTFTATATLTITNLAYTVTEPTVATPGAYNGTPQALLATEGSLDPDTAGTIKYLAVAEGTADEDVAASEDWSDTIPEETNAGKYDVYYKVVPADGYSATDPTLVGTVEIGKRQITVTAGNLEVTYGTAVADVDYTSVEVTVTGMLDGHDATSTSCTSAYAAGANADETFEIVPSLLQINNGAVLTSNYQPNVVNGTLTVTPATLLITAENKTMPYGTADADIPELTYTIGDEDGAKGLVNDDTEDVFTGALACEVTSESSVAGSPYAITQGTLSAGDNYEIEFVEGEFEITPLVAKFREGLKQAGRTLAYQETALNLVLASKFVTDDGVVMFYVTEDEAETPDPEEDTFAAGVPTRENAGTYYVWYYIDGDENHSDSELASVKTVINKASNKDVVAPTIETMYYNGGDQDLVTAGTCSTGTWWYALGTDSSNAPDDDPEDPDNPWSTEVPRATDVGNYYVWYKLVGDENHKNLEPNCRTPQIRPAPVTITAPDDLTKVYGTSDEDAFDIEEHPATITSDIEFVEGFDLSAVEFVYSYARNGEENQGEDVGTYEVIPTGETSQGDGNFTVTFNTADPGTLTITPATVTVTAPDDVYKIYGDTDPDYTEIVEVDGLIGSGDVTITMDDSTKVYTAVRMNGTVEEKVTFKILRTTGENASDTAHVIDVQAYPDAEQGNYNVVCVDGAILIAKAPLTATAKSVEKDYGDADPEDEYAVEFLSAATELKNGDDLETVISGIEFTFTREGKAEGKEDVGEYAITPASKDDAEPANYYFNFVDGTLTINKAAGSAGAPTAASVYYNGEAQDLLTAEATPSQNLDGTNDGKIVYAVTDSTTAPTEGYAEGVPQGTEAGDYYVWYKSIDGTNHEDSAAAWVLAKINPREITVTITGTSETLFYDGTEQEISGFTPSTTDELYDLDNVALKDGKTASAKGKTVDDYEMGLTADDFVNNDGNFAVTFEIEDGVLTIAPRPIIITAKNSEIEYGDSLPTEYDYEVSSNDVDAPYIVAGDTLTVRFNNSSEANSGNVGTYEKGIIPYGATVANADGDVTDNYAFTYVEGDLTITPKTVSIVWVFGEEEYTAAQIAELEDGLELTYNGENQAPTAYAADAEGTKITALEVATNLETAIDAADYTVTASFEDTNYILADETRAEEIAFTIVPQEVSIVWVFGEEEYTAAQIAELEDGLKLTYNGENQAPTAYAADAEGAKITALEVATNLEEAINAADYEVTASFENTNYVLADATRAEEIAFTIVPQEVSIVWVFGEDEYTAAQIAELEDGLELTYNGENQAPTAYAADAEGAKIAALEVATNLEEAIDADDYDVTASFENTNYVLADATRAEEIEFTIVPLAVTVTITGTSDTKVYNGEEQSVEGYDVDISDALYTEDDFTFSGEAVAKGTIVGTYTMGLDGKFTNTNDNFDVTFEITDGELEITALAVTVTVTGTSDTKVYNGEEQSVEGYEVEIVDALELGLYTEDDFTFSGEAVAKGTDVGTYAMGLDAEDFANTNDNFDVTFEIEADGELEITALSATVTITGNKDSKVYNGEEQKVEGYEVEIADDLELGLYTEDDFTFSGEAVAKGTDVGKYAMGLDAEDFTNINDNFDVTFEIEADGELEITKAKAEVTKAPTAKIGLVAGTTQELVNAGEGKGGTLKYKLGEDGKYSEKIPTASTAGTYTVFYKVFGDANHFDSDEGSVKVTINPGGSPGPGPGPGPSPTTKYTVTLADTENGTIAFNTPAVTGKTAELAADAAVKVTVTPAEKYKVDKVSYTTEGSNTPVVLTAGDDGLYSFMMPAANVTVTATFALINHNDPSIGKDIIKKFSTGYLTCDGKNCPLKKFRDLDPSAWYHDGIHFCLENSIMQGFGTEDFLPDGLTTRAQVVTVLWNIAGHPIANSSITFDDVKKGDWYYDAIMWAAANGIVIGYGDGKFGPDDYVTHEQIAKIFYGYAKFYGFDVSAKADISGMTGYNQLDEWAIPYVEWGVGAGLCCGKNGNTSILGAKDEANRAELAVTLLNFCINIAS